MLIKSTIQRPAAVGKKPNAVGIIFLLKIKQISLLKAYNKDSKTEIIFFNYWQNI